MPQEVNMQRDIELWKLLRSVIVFACLMEGLFF
jgi:hypothetical protein